MRLRDAYTEWLHSRSDIAYSTFKDYQSIGDTYLLPLAGHWRVDRVQRAEVMALLNQVTPGRRSRVKVVLALVLDHVGAPNPVRQIRVPGPTPKQVRRVPTVEEVDALASVCGHYEGFVRVAAFSGLRWGELVALERSDINPPIVEVTKAWCMRSHQVKPPKSQAGWRRVVVLPEGEPWLPAGGHGLAFTTLEGRRIASANFLHRTWARAKKETGLTWRFHDLRHTYATLLLQRGVPITQVSAMLGHSKVSVTLDIYAGFLQDPVDEVRRLLGV